MSDTTHHSNFGHIAYNGDIIEVAYFYGDNPSVRVCDSYKITKSYDIKRVLEMIHDNGGYKRLCKKTGYSRTFKSQYREWKAHNFLYKLGIFRMRTGSVDLDQNESKFRRFVYAILSIF